MIDLTPLAIDMSGRHNIPIKDVSACCPAELKAFNSQGYVSRHALERLVDAWIQEVLNIVKKREERSFDARRLAHFRKRFGPHITKEHLPRGEK